MIGLLSALRSRRIVAAIFSVAALTAGVAAYLIYTDSSAPRGAVTRWDVEIADDPLGVADVERRFSEIGYDLDGVKRGRGGVPRVLVRTIPDDLGQVPEVTRRKSLFLGAVLPLALAVNEQIAAERAVVEALDEKLKHHEMLSGNDAEELDRLARIYRIIGSDDEEDDEIENTTVAKEDRAGVVKELLLRAAPLPVSLILAQAAEESAWGLSRFAAEGNALYGQWVWNDAAGIVPANRPRGETYSVRAFRDIYESTLSYAHNLNTHPAYKHFRRMRAAMLKSGGRLDGHILAGALIKYSGRGQAYIESLRAIMRANGLSALDRVRFTDQTPPRTLASRRPDHMLL